MNLWKLSLCYLGRKKGKTITLFIVFFTIGMCLISLSGISRSLEKKIISSQERVVYLTASNGAAWPGKAKEALQAADITKKLEACRLTAVKTGLRLLSLSQSTAEEPGTLTVAGYGQTASLSAFQSRRLLLIRGRHLTAEDRDQALMHAALAEKKPAGYRKDHPRRRKGSNHCQAVYAGPAGRQSAAAHKPCKHAHRP